MATKYIFVTGGVLSGLGKGITAASIGNILVRRGYKVFMQKFDQYLNVDAGTLNPNEHGEVFVTDDGAEADLDLGHYERFIDTNMTKASSVMSGQIYAQLLEKERRGDYLGKTVQFIAHLVPLVCEHIEAAAKEQHPDVLITEIGGTVGDYEGLLFIEAARQMVLRAGRENVMYVHVGFLPYLEVTEEVKSKPLQNSIDDLRRFGIQPDLVMARCDHHVPAGALKKVALFGGLPEEAVVPLETVSSVYEVPLVLERYKVDQQVMKRLGLPRKKAIDRSWEQLVARIKAVRSKGPKETVTVALVGKYMEMKDTYMSVTESIKAAGWHESVKINEVWIEAEEIEKAGAKGLAKLFKDVDAVVVPGGFGTRGVEGIIMAADYCRRLKIPYLGLCYGMQLAVVAHARAVGLTKANTTEVDKDTPHPVIDILPDQDLKKLGGTMRLGAYTADLAADTQIARLYQELRPKEAKKSGDKVEVSERHRHRYEVNPEYHARLATQGLRFAGLSPDGTLVEFIEYDAKTHPYFVGTQAHPELKSRPNRPHPLFVGLIRAAKKK
jgi:CTP synthase